MRIAHLISNLGSGGAESMLAKVASAGREHGVEPLVITLISGGVARERLIQSGIEVLELGASRSWSAMAVVPRVAFALRERNVDLLQGWMYHGDLLASLAHLISPSKPKVVWNVRQTLESVSTEIARTQAVIRGCAWAVRRRRLAPMRIVYNASAAAEQHEQLLGYPRDKRVVIPNGFDLEQFRPSQAAGLALRAKLSVDESAILVGRIARDHRMKDVFTLLAAFAEIAQHEDRAHLVLVGKGMARENNNLAKLLENHSAASRIHCLGEVADPSRVIPGFDVTVSSSSHGEAFPNVIGESMSCGVPCISTDVGACAEVIGDPARVVQPRNPLDLARAVLRVLALPAHARRQLGLHDRTRVSRYDIAAVTSAYVDLWRSCVEDRA